METTICISNQPTASELWERIGGHFDTLGQIINEFLDNGVSDFSANPSVMRNIIVKLWELSPNGDARISIEDSGTWIKDLGSMPIAGISVSLSIAEKGRGMVDVLQTEPAMQRLPMIRI